MPGAFTAEGVMWRLIGIALGATVVWLVSVVVFWLDDRSIRREVARRCATGETE